MRISIKALLQSVMLYLMLIAGWSTLYWHYSNIAPIILIVVAVAIKLVTKQNLLKNTDILFILIFSLFIIVNRLIWDNDTGFGSLLEFIAPVFIVDTYINLDKDSAVPRFIKGITIYALFSVGLWLICIVSPNLLKTILHPIPNNIFDLYGELFYTIQGSASTVRNCGLYTEPGLYQIILNVALFLLLNTQSHNYYSRSQIIRYMVILLAAIFSTLSSTGIITAAIIVIFSLRGQTSVKKPVILISIILFVAILLDYQIRGTGSVMYKYVLAKISVFGQSSEWGTLNSIDARLRALKIVGFSLTQNVFGVGGAAFQRYTVLYNAATIAGNGLFRWLAILGIHTWLLLIAYIFVPLFRSKVQKQKILIFAVVYVLYTMSQLYIFIPVLLFASAELIYDETMNNKTETGWNYE